jgi:GT2 family glycosyltransferase
LDLTIIVVSYNTRRLVEDCLRSVERHLEGRLDHEVIVVDNDSRDGTPEWLEGSAASMPRVRLLRAGANLGFSGGNNLGIRAARGRHVLLLNSDAYLVDDSLVEALAYLDAHPDVFALAGLLLLADGRPGPSYGHFPTPGTVARELFGRRFAALRAVCPAPGEPTHDIDFPCGAYYLMNGRLLKELGGLDEAFFMYYEETDLAMRARLKGYRNVYFAGAKAVHLGGQSTQEVKSAYLTRMFYANWRRFLLKHHGPWAAFLVRLQLTAYFALAGLSHSVRGDSRGAEFLRAHGRALADGWAGRL